MSKTYEQFRKSLQEGTLSVPTTKAKWNNLQKIMTKKLPVGDEGAKDSADTLLHRFLDDDNLSGTLRSLRKKKGPNADARPAILQWLKRNGFDIKKRDGYKDSDWTKNEEVENIDELTPQQRNLKRKYQMKTGGRKHGGEPAIQKKGGGDKGSSWATAGSRAFVKKKHVSEGTWAVPTTKAQWTKLQKLMTKKLPVGDSESNDKKVWSKSAGHQIYNLVGDDKLADDLDMLEIKGRARVARGLPDEDARPVILKWLKKNDFDIKKKDGYKSASWSHPGRKGADWTEEVEIDEAPRPKTAKAVRRRERMGKYAQSGKQDAARTAKAKKIADKERKKYGKSLADIAKELGTDDIRKIMKHANQRNESEAPSSTVGSVKGGMVGEPPGPTKKKKKKYEIFAGDCVFEVSTDTFNKCKGEKPKYARYIKHIGDDEDGQIVREYGLRNPSKGIVIKDSTYGAMMYLRRRKS